MSLEQQHKNISDPIEYEKGYLPFIRHLKQIIESQIIDPLILGYSARRTALPHEKNIRWKHSHFSCANIVKLLLLVLA
jgi:uncharacterized protein YqhQ